MGLSPVPLKQPIITTAYDRLGLGSIVKGISRARNRQNPPSMTTLARKRTRFGTWNVRTMTDEVKTAAVCKEFRTYHLDILGLSETRWADSGDRRMTSGEFLLYSGTPERERRRSGVGFLLTQDAKSSLLDWMPVSDHNCEISCITQQRIVCSSVCANGGCKIGR